MAVSGIIVIDYQLSIGSYSFLFFYFSRTQKVNDPCGQHIYKQEQCSTFGIDKDK